MTFLAFVHIALAVFLIVLVLLQDSKGGALGAFGAGSSSSVFGSTGGSDFLTTSTKWLAIFFSATCIILAYMTTNQKSVLDSHIPQVEAPKASKTLDTKLNEKKTSTSTESKKK